MLVISMITCSIGWAVSGVLMIPCGEEGLTGAGGGEGGMYGAGAEGAVPRLEE